MPEVREHMGALQQRLAKMGFSRGEIVNVDETPSYLAPPLLFKYGVAGEQRTAIPDDPNEKNRITAVVGLNGEGGALPPVHIIKTSITGDDQSNQRVLTKLKADLGGDNEGWVQREWTRRVMVSGKEKTFVRPYIINTKNGRVIWAQAKAYQDTAGLIMYLDLVLTPYKDRIGASKIALVWDNCSCHLNKDVILAHQAAGVHVEPLIRDMTDQLQPVDIIANGPLKAAQRRNRAGQLYDYHQTYVGDCRAMAAAGKPLPIFKPPNATLLSFIRMHHEIWDDTFGSEAFRAAARRVFINVGICPTDGGAYIEYTSHEDPVYINKPKRLFNFLGLSEPPDSTSFLATSLFELDFGEDDSEETQEEEGEGSFLAFLAADAGDTGDGGGGEGQSGASGDMAS